MTRVCKTHSLRRWCCFWWWLLPDVTSTTSLWQLSLLLTFGSFGFSFSLFSHLSFFCLLFSFFSNHSPFFSTHFISHYVIECKQSNLLNDSVSLFFSKMFLHILANVTCQMAWVLSTRYSHFHFFVFRQVSPTLHCTLECIRN